MRIELAKNPFKTRSDFADEPTNHMDIESIQWLEDFMNEAKAVVVISHDRAFVDNITKSYH
jgi:ATP-binding cassette subfamily F protein 3